MMERTETTNEGVVIVRVGGVLHHDDYQQVESWIDQAAARSPTGKADIVFEFKGVKGITPRAMLDDAKLGLYTANREVRRMAVVAESRWVDAVTKMFNPITRYQMKHFEPEARDKAVRWAGEHSNPGAVRL